MKLMNAKMAMVDSRRMAPILARRKERADMRNPLESIPIMAGDGHGSSRKGPLERWD